MNRPILVLVAFAFVLAPLLGLSTVGQDPPPALDFIIDSDESGSDADLADGLCATAEGDCTLVAAIQQANAAPGLQRITFSPVIVDLEWPELPVTDPLEIVGPASGCNPFVEISVDGPISFTADATGSRLQRLALLHEAGFGTGSVTPLMSVAGADVAIQNVWFNVHPDASVGRDWPDRDGLWVEAGGDVTVSGPCPSVFAGLQRAVAVETDGTASIQGSMFGVGPRGRPTDPNGESYGLGSHAIWVQGHDVTIGPDNVIGQAETGVYATRATGTTSIEGNLFGEGPRGHYLPMDNVMFLSEIYWPGSFSVVDNVIRSAEYSGEGTGMGIWVEYGEGGVIQGNHIGGPVLTNGCSGIRLEGSIDTLVGGDGPGEGNIIERNGAGCADTGVRVLDDAGNEVVTGNQIIGNAIFGSIGLGIDLPALDGPDFQDVVPVAVASTGFAVPPVLEAADPVAGTIGGAMIPNANAAAGDYRIDVYGNQACNPSGFGEGQIWLGSTTVAATPGSATAFSIPVDFAGGVGSYFSATATGPSDTTSEFSACIEAVRADLRAAISSEYPTVLPSTPGYFSANINHDGNTAAQNVVARLEGPLAPYTIEDSFVDGATGVICTPDAAGITCNIDSMSPGGFVSIDASMTVPLGNHPHSWTVTSDLYDGWLADNEAHVDIVGRGVPAAIRISPAVAALPPAGGVVDFGLDVFDGDGLAIPEEVVGAMWQVVLSDNCPLDANPDQLDTDDDTGGQGGPAEGGDACDSDDDGDGFSDIEEMVAGSSSIDSFATPGDLDGDGLRNEVDPCPTLKEGSVSTTDHDDVDEGTGDGIGEGCDPNPAVIDADADGDHVPDSTDNCPNVVNPGQTVAVGDTIGRACSDDPDGDGRTNDVDLCPDHPNPDGTNTDGVDLEDACDDDDDNDGATDLEERAALSDPLDASSTPVNVWTNGIDSDGDGASDFQEMDYGTDPHDPTHNPTNPDKDGHAVPNDNCPQRYNPDQIDSDGDGRGDVCDVEPLDDTKPGSDVGLPPDEDADNDGTRNSWELADGFDPLDPLSNPDDWDRDGVDDYDDNCPIWNPDQIDFDRDNRGDACDDAPRDPSIIDDPDGDGVEAFGGDGNFPYGDGFYELIDFCEGPCFFSPSVTKIRASVDDLVAEALVYINIDGDFDEALGAGRPNNQNSGFTQETFTFASNAVRPGEVARVAGSGAMDNALVTFNAPASNVAVSFEVGGVGGPLPPDVDLAALEAEANGRPRGVVINVALTEGGEQVDSARKNEILGPTTIQFRVAESYFSSNRLTPSNFCLVEFSDGVLVDPCIPASQVGRDGMNIIMEATLTQYSTFIGFGSPITWGGGPSAPPVVPEAPADEAPSESPADDAATAPGDQGNQAGEFLSMIVTPHEDGATVKVYGAATTDLLRIYGPAGTLLYEGSAADGAEFVPPQDGTYRFETHRGGAVIVEEREFLRALELPADVATAIAASVAMVAVGSALLQAFSRAAGAVAEEAAIALSEEHVVARKPDAARYGFQKSLPAMFVALILLTMFFAFEGLEGVAWTWSSYIDQLPIVGLAALVSFLFLFGSEVLVSRADGVVPRFRFLVSGALSLAASAIFFRVAIGYPGYFDAEEENHGDPQWLQALRAFTGFSLAWSGVLFFAIATRWWPHFADTGLEFSLVAIFAGSLMFAPLPGYDIWRFRKSASLVVIVGNGAAFIAYVLGSLSIPVIATVATVQVLLGVYSLLALHGWRMGKNGPTAERLGVLVRSTYTAWRRWTPNVVLRTVEAPSRAVDKMSHIVMAGLIAVAQRFRGTSAQ